MVGNRGGSPEEKRVGGVRQTGVGFPRWRGAGEIAENYATSRNISQSKKCNDVGGNKTVWEPH